MKRYKAAPKRLKAEGKKLWKKLLPELDALGFLNSIDYEALEALCDCWQTYVFCTDQLAKSTEPMYFKAKSGFAQPNPLIAIKQRALDTFVKLCVKFGIMPYSRDKIRHEEKKADKPTKWAGLA